MQVRISWKGLSVVATVLRYDIHNLDEQLQVTFTGPNGTLEDVTLCRQLDSSWQDYHHPNDRGQAKVKLIAKSL